MISYCWWQQRIVLQLKILFTILLQRMTTTVFKGTLLEISYSAYLN